MNPQHPDQPLHDESFLASAPGTCSAVGDRHYHTDRSEPSTSRPASPRRVVPRLGPGHVFGRGRPALPHVPNCLFHSTVTVVNPQHPDQPLHDESFLASAPGTCSAVGDPHYHTFDGKLFSFSGDCWYTLAKNKNPLEEQFAVLADNARCDIPGWEHEACTRAVPLQYRGNVIFPAGNTRPVPVPLRCDIPGWEHEACTRAVKVQYRGSEVLLTRDSITLDGQAVQGSVSHNSITVEKIENSYFHKVTLANGLEVLWDSHTRVYVKSPGMLQGRTAGLCGDFNGSPEDDFTTPSGSTVLLADTFAQSWKTGDCTP
ncbi:KCP [Branchiostoma lanceolatum]|uniref:KCP protein n=1 Tax=Branchiostoma lanceolatum TaxID=7740 RepID=A0A8J9Z5L2_BRALA|nr:KCP [Branchiostoma lanceolatum]